jgi:hypothetical protein
MMLNATPVHVNSTSPNSAAMQKNAVTKVAELDKEAHCVHQDTPLFVAIRKHSDCLLLNEG